MRNFGNSILYYLTAILFFISAGMSVGIAVFFIFQIILNFIGDIK